MIPVLYENTEKEFRTNGLGALTDCTDAIVTEERNGKFEIELKYPVTGLHYDQIDLGRIILAKPNETSDPQPFSIYKISKPISGMVTVSGRHISYRLSEIPVKRDKTKSGSAAAAMERLRIGALETCPFEFWTDNDYQGTYTNEKIASMRSRLGGSEGSVLDVFGGEYEWDRWTVKLHKHRGTDSGVVLRYGKNITDLTQQSNIENTYTGVIAFYDGDDGYVAMDAPVYASNADNYPYHKTAVLDLSDKYETIPTADTLKAYCESYVKQTGFGVPKISIKVSFAALWQTEEYKEIAPLERVRLCDTVGVEFEKLGVSASAKVVKTAYDPITERYRSIELGTATAKMSSTVAGLGDKIADAVKDTRSAMQKAVDHATDLISGGLGGHVVIAQNANGEPNEILVMDTDDTATAVNVIRINEAGIGFSTSGYNGPFQSAWTIDGKLVADFITSGTLSANLIKAGVIADKAGKNTWDMASGVLSMQSGTIKLGDNFEVDSNGNMTAQNGNIAGALTTVGDGYKVYINGDHIRMSKDGEKYPLFNMSASTSQWTYDQSVENGVIEKATDTFEVMHLQNLSIGAAESKRAISIWAKQILRLQGFLSHIDVGYMITLGGPTNVLGTLYQNGKSIVPEYKAASTGNGGYLRFPNLKLQICWCYQKYSASTGWKAWGNIFELGGASGVEGISWPAEFTATPFPVVTAYADKTDLMVSTYGWGSKSKTPNVFLQRGTAPPDGWRDYYIYYVGIGTYT